jgi:hypothetical protein
LRDNCCKEFKRVKEEKIMSIDERPKIGEFFISRGIGYDLVGFVRTKQVGERVIEMFKKIIGENCKTWLDWRKYESNWIQIKIQKEDCDLEKLCKLIEDVGVITEEMIEQSKRK